MKSLSETWFAEGYIDFELKKYTLLAYLQEVNKYFNENKLYPQLADVIFHYNNLVAFRENKKFLQEHFPKKLSGIPLETHEGYFFLSNGTKSTRVYYYRLSIFEKHDEKYRSIKTSFIDLWQRSMSHTYESIKRELIRNRSELPNPAVYA